MANIDFRKIPPNRLHWYCGLDVASTLALYDHQRANPGRFMETWRRLHGPALHGLGMVERWGALLDRDNVMAYDGFLKGRYERVRADMKAKYPQVPEELNVKSPKQMKVLFEETLKLKTPLRTKGGAPSYSDEALELMAKAQPDGPVAMIRQLKSAREMLAMYGSGQLKHIGYDGRVHTKYRVIRSGRLASREPNLQNLKSPDDDPDLAEEDDNGKWARGCWICPPGWVWVNLDYSQVELRVAAMLSGDENMIAAFASGKDFHQERAAQIFSKPGDQVTKLERRIAKVINFMIPYGASEFAVAAELGITKEKAEEYINAYMDSAPGLARWLRGEVSRGQQHGASWAVWQPEGWTHKRDVYDIGEPTGGMYGRDALKRVGHAERVCKNNPIQNIANCFSLASLARCVAWLEDTGIPAELNMTVHDNLAFYAREDVWQEVATEARRIMQDYETGPVKLKVDCEIGRRDLGHLEKVKLAA